MKTDPQTQDAHRRVVSTALRGLAALVPVVLDTGRDAHGGVLDLDTTREAGLRDLVAAGREAEQLLDAARQAAGDILREVDR